MTMTEKAAQLYSMHLRKIERLWDVFLNANPYVNQDHLIQLAKAHTTAAHIIYNCPDSWEKSETDRKLAEIKSYLGQPLYDEWLEAGAAENFEQYVANEYIKTFVAKSKECAEDLFRQAENLMVEQVKNIELIRQEEQLDPRTPTERAHDEAGADLERMNGELRHG